VKLIGWCRERGELLLVYEYFPMGRLDELLYANARAGVMPLELAQIKLGSTRTTSPRYDTFPDISPSLMFLNICWI
jgi:hypothetical protein